MFTSQDLPLHQGLRRRMIAMLREKNINDEFVLQAMSEIPRHLYYFDGAFVEHAYSDMAFQIGYGQTISNPYTVAFQSSLLCIKKMDKVLEIGTGSGYQASVLSKMGARIFSIERQKSLFQSTNVLLEKLNIKNVQTFFGDGFKGLPTYAPFDKIIITCGAPFVPDDLKKQLKVGGIMVIPIGEGDVQKMLRLVKIDENTFEETWYNEFRFVPMLQGKAY